VILFDRDLIASRNSALFNSNQNEF